MILITLIKAIIKTFLRNKESIILLILAPFLLIIIIFISFSTKGMHPVSAGIIGNIQEMNITQYKDSYFSFLKLTEYNDLDSCIQDIKKYKQYLCLEMRNTGVKLQLNIYYDNTREPIIWQVIERIQFTIDMFQDRQSTQMTSNILGNFGQTADNVDSFRSNFTTYNNKIDMYILDISQSQQKLRQVQSDLRDTIYSMDQDIDEARATKNEMEDEKDDFYDDAISSTNEIENLINNFPVNDSTQYSYINQMRERNYEARQKIYQYNSEANYKFYEFDSKLSSYEYTSQRSQQYVRDIDSEVSDLETTKKELTTYKGLLQKADSSIQGISQNFRSLSSINPEDIINPFIVQSLPTYVPEIKQKNETKENITEDSSAKELSEGISLLGLQTIYPTVVFLILLFLSLIISTFITLSYINSPANNRISLVKGVIISEIFSIYISSLFIVLIPMLCILAVGELLFELEIFSNILPIVFMIILVASAFIFLGMILSQIIRKESITLLIMTFLLVLFTFFSGFVLPIERMSTIAGQIAQHSPTNLGLETFKVIIFYDNPLSVLLYQINILLITLLSLFIILMFFSYIKR